MRYKKEFKEKAKQQIYQLFAKAEELEAKKEKASDKVKAQYKEKISGLLAQQQELKNKYNELKNDSDD